MACSSRWENRNPSNGTHVVASPRGPRSRRQSNRGCLTFSESPKLSAAVWKRWQELDPVNAVARHAGALKRLRTLWFDAGTRDEFHLHLGARRLSDALKRLKVPHLHEEHGFGHMDMNSRLDVSLPLLTRRLARVVR